MGIILGAIYLSMGIKENAKATSMDPAVDFQLLALNCTVISSTFGSRDKTEKQQRLLRNTHNKQKGKNKKSVRYCEDTVFWEFSTQNTNISYPPTVVDSQLRGTFRSITDTNTRCTDCACADNKYDHPNSQWVGSFQVNQSTKCWKPTSLVMLEGSLPVYKTDVGYRCGNDPCVKIVDPQIDVHNMATQAATTLYFLQWGGVLGAGVVISLLSCYVLKSGIVNKDHDGDGDSDGDGDDKKSKAVV